MNLILIILIVLLVFGGGGVYLGRPSSELNIVWVLLVMVLIMYLAGVVGGR